MKKILLTAMIFTSLASFASATQQVNHEVTIVTEKPIETPIKPENLPAEVKKTLAGEAYSTSKVSSAVHVKEGEKEYYKVELVNGEVKQTVTIDKVGQVVVDKK